MHLEIPGEILTIMHNYLQKKEINAKEPSSVYFLFKKIVGYWFLKVTITKKYFHLLLSLLFSFYILYIMNAMVKCQVKDKTFKLIELRLRRPENKSSESELSTGKTYEQ